MERFSEIAVSLYSRLPSCVTVSPNVEGGTMSNRKTLRIKEVMDLTGLSRATIYREIKRGKFPSSVELSAGAVGWMSDEVDQWFEERPRRITPEEPAT